MALIDRLRPLLTVNGHDTIYPIACVVFNQDGTVVHRNPNRKRLLPIHLCLIIEGLVHFHALTRAHRYYQRAHCTALDLRTYDHLPPLPADGVGMLAVGSHLWLCPITRIDDAYRLINLANQAAYISSSPPLDVIKQRARDLSIVDVTVISDETTSVVRLLQNHYCHTTRDLPSLEGNQFVQAITELLRAGLVTIPFGQVRLGDLARESPLCPDYGFSRGLPIDRYYLNHFIRRNRESVTGRTLEIGGKRSNIEVYGLQSVTKYVTVDSDAKSEADVIADVHDPNCFGPSSFDSVIVFNVLEHCRAPWVVVQNIHSWLRPGGRVLCLVPNAQRIHRDPMDYWRILPDALQMIFDRFRIVSCESCGSLLTAQAALAGVAAEELSIDDLSFSNPQFPVVSTIVAEKKGVD